MIYFSLKIDKNTFRHYFHLLIPLFSFTGYVAHHIKKNLKYIYIPYRYYSLMTYPKLLQYNGVIYAYDIDLRY